MPKPLTWTNVQQYQRFSERVIGGWFANIGDSLLRRALENRWMRFSLRSMNAGPLDFYTFLNSIKDKVIHVTDNVRRIFTLEMFEIVHLRYLRYLAYMAIVENTSARAEVSNPTGTLIAVTPTANSERRVRKKRERALRARVEAVTLPETEAGTSYAEETTIIEHEETAAQVESTASVQVVEEQPCSAPPPSTPVSKAKRGRDQVSVNSVVAPKQLKAKTTSNKSDSSKSEQAFDQLFVDEMHHSLTSGIERAFPSKRKETCVCEGFKKVRKRLRDNCSELAAYAIRSGFNVMKIAPTADAATVMSQRWNLFKDRAERPTIAETLCDRCVRNVVLAIGHTLFGPEFDVPGDDRCLKWNC